MKFKPDADPVSTSEFYYDLIEGGYINPSAMLADDADVQRVKRAIDTIEEFKELAEDAGLITEA